ncbi:DoxX family membrane protein [Streptomyces sp. NBRC 109706]|uniref:DoxX family membrane protein n=1 Tax=Streptomyces sp. NBRC 109706 TaxID=1550035 RepID=UPI0007825E3A|nr:DoxX family membrane protein [Streptomyces sp. NBRC 109706]
MTLHDTPRASDGASRPLTAPADAAAPARADAPAAARFLALLRIAIGFVFVWAFLDKAFGLGYATRSGNAWVDGGSPTRGFLSNVSVGPLESTFQDMAGAVWADWLFMLGLLGIGVAVCSGMGLRIAAVAGSLMMLLMWAAEWPPARHLSDGSPSMSSNPFMDSHLVYALLLIALALCRAGDTWGLGRFWSRLPVVRTTPWLR